ncbi:pTP protein [Fowl adenovirus 8b]|uniref:PTP protein n=1 Tax=Fowl adenovirus 8b TaxID=586029 RepID=A0A166LWJ7_9ADEN|nr:pTP protein [Fowl adenovirus 8b]
MVRHQPALVNPNSVALVSRLYDYRLMQLRDLSPGGPNVAAYPYHRLPPPHLLLGYQYMHRALNDYFFENRVFMQLGYESPPAQRPRRLFWTCLTDCSYSVNVGAYMRFLDLDNFHDSFQQMHNAVLMDRIASDMAHVHLRGRGVDVARSGDVVGGGGGDLAAAGEDDGDDAAAAATAAARSHLSGSGAAGLQNDILLRAASRDDAVLLEAIRRLRVALCHYLFCYARERFNTENTYRFLPGSDVFGEENWLTLFTDAFAELDTQSLLRQAALDPRDHHAEEPAETMARCFVSTLATGQDYDAESRGRGGFSGGAIVLRNRRVTDRRGLRPRDRTGRAITASQVRRVRRRAAELDTQSLLRQAALDPRDHAEEPAETMARCFVSTLATGQDYDAESRGRGGFSGGAIVLRNRRVTDRRGLRPRDRTGRAITASQVRRVRRRAVREFIDRLPRVIRRRRVPRPEPAVEEEEPMVEEWRKRSPSRRLPRRRRKKKKRSSTKSSAPFSKPSTPCKKNSPEPRAGTNSSDLPTTFTDCSCKRGTPTSRSSPSLSYESGFSTSFSPSTSPPRSTISTRISFLIANSVAMSTSPPSRSSWSDGTSTPSPSLNASGASNLTPPPFSKHSGAASCATFS